MALALLCGELAQTISIPAPVAFVVDHRAREGSNEEASWVYNQLRQKFGQTSLILTKLFNVLTFFKILLLTF